jgi:hypothetical protein
MSTLNKYLLLLISLISLAACSGGGGGGGETPGPGPQPQPNTAPVANAGTDQSVNTGNTVSLSGGGSSDANNDTLTFAWTLSTAPAGSASTITNDTAVSASFVPDVDGTYTIQLIVNDGTVNSAADTIAVTATTPNTAPTANAGADQNVTTGATVTVDGVASSDPEGSNLTFAWTITNQPSNSTAMLSDAAVMAPTFVANVNGTYTLQLVVNDGSLASTPDTVDIIATTPNSAPTANAGMDQNIATSAVVTLDGSGSTDVDGDNITYTWSLSSVPQNSAAALSDTSAVSPTFTADLDGTYTAQLIVNDGQVDSAADSVDVVATTANSAPVANAGTDASVETGTLVTLDGSASVDSDNDMITYAWTLSTVPTGSTAALSDATSAMPTFTADLDGTYVASLVVNDSALNSQADTVTVTAATSNTAPVANAGMNQNVITTNAVTLDGTASSDADGDTLTYIWSFMTIPAGSTATLSNADQAMAMFTPDAEGAYIAQLIVNDGTENSLPTTVTVNATRFNAAPVAVAGTNDVILNGFNANLDGTASTDADGDPLTYLWSFVSVPTGSMASFNDETSATPFFNVDQDGTYVVSLVVNDGRESSAANTVTFQAVTPTISLQRQQSRMSGPFNEVGLSYNAGDTSTFALPDPNVASIVLATFKLNLTGRDYTIIDLSATNTDGNSAIIPSFDGITDGQTISDGVETTFTVVAQPTSQSTENLNFVFRIKETGQVFSLSVTLRTN